MERIVERGDKLPFTCLRCGNCCSSGPNVALTSFDICRIAKYLGVPWRSLIGKYVYAVVADAIPVPLLAGIGGKCVFLKEAKNSTSCSIYPARPMRCRLFPFLPRGPSDVNKLELSSICPGVGVGKPVNPPWEELEKFSKESKLHYEYLFKHIFQEGLNPVDALEKTIDELCEAFNNQL